MTTPAPLGPWVGGSGTRLSRDNKPTCGCLSTWVTQCGSPVPRDNERQAEYKSTLHKVNIVKEPYIT